MTPQLAADDKLRCCRYRSLVFFSNREAYCKMTLLPITTPVRLTFVSAVENILCTSDESGKCVFRGR